MNRQPYQNLYVYYDIGIGSIILTSINKYLWTILNSFLDSASLSLLAHVYCGNSNLGDRQILFARIGFWENVKMLSLY